MSKLGKPFLKNQIKTENQLQTALCQQKTTSKKWKFGSYKKKQKNRPRVNYAWIGRTILKKSDPKTLKK